MSEKLSSSFQKARDEALRALVEQGGLTPAQISELRLDQVHLSTSTLVIEPDEFDPATAATERPITLKLDDALRRALIAWLVVRPDGPNRHLFPGTGSSGLDVESINQVIAPDKPARKPEAQDEMAPPGRAEADRPVKPAEAGPPGSAVAEREEEEKPARPPRPAPERPGEHKAVPLDEIETLRKRLAETYDAWAPAVTTTGAGVAKPAARSDEGKEVPSAPPARAETPAEMPDTETTSEVMEPPPPAERTTPARTPAAETDRMRATPDRPAPTPQPVPVRAPTPEAERTEAPEPPLKPAEEVDMAVTPAPPSAGLGSRLRGRWEPGEGKLTLSLTYRTAALAGVALLLGVCCLSFIIASGTMLGQETIVGLLPGIMPTATQTPTVEVSTPTPLPSPTGTTTPTPTPTLAPSATFTASPAPTHTQPPAPTPVIVVVTATPTPEPPPTATPIPTNTPEGGAPPSEPSPAETPGFKYAAPVLVWPEDGSTVPGVINILQWEPVGPLAEEEWYAVRLMYRQQGQLVYAGDRVKVPEWRVPDRLYYQADGPDLKYSWYVFVERDNPDGSTTQLSPNSETFVFRWE